MEEVARISLPGVLAHLHRGDALTVGRHPVNDVVLRHPSISRFHATLAWERSDEAPDLVDLFSCNGSALDGRALRGGEPAAVRGGCQVRFGKVPGSVDLLSADAAWRMSLAEFARQGHELVGWLARAGGLQAVLEALERAGTSGVLRLPDLEASPVGLLLDEGRLVRAWAGERRGQSALMWLAQQPALEGRFRLAVAPAIDEEPFVSGGPSISLRAGVAITLGTAAEAR